ncbi:hypothetical protein LX81_02491 [Palleronia aestuarii]|uniref:Uncharacterized protein n=2 Tax=Palleronia aestuarii TaxID=568105 RepID=A0A2W7N577_9RHOB|nr:hypothetical protein LX81_02491 [Palleronia aestuarii]
MVGLAVNQINISGTSSFGPSRASNAGVSIRSSIFSEPSLSIGDNSGAFELNLQRSSYAASELPFRDELLREITDEFLHSCLWQLTRNRSRSFPKYEGLEKRVYGKYEPKWLDCSDGIILNEPRFLKRYDPTFCLNRYGGGSEPTFFQSMVGALPDRSIYFHDANDEFTGRSFNMKGKLARVLRGEALKFVKETTKSQLVFVPAAFVDLILKDMKPGKDIRKTLEGLSTDTVSGWMHQSSEKISESVEIRDWRKGLDKNGKDTCVISLHSLSTQSFEPNDSKDDVVFDRWMDLLGQPFLPRTANDLSQLQRRLSDRLESKYEIFEERAKQAQKKQESEAKKKAAKSEY